jgi:hypothetical protein
MLNSIQTTYDSIGYSEDISKNNKQYPTFENICNDIFGNDSAYICVQRMGSHAIHGTWADLYSSYLNYDNNKFSLKDNISSKPQENNFTLNNLLILEAIIDYTKYYLNEDELKDEIIDILIGIKEEILDYEHISAKNDFKISR